MDQENFDNAVTIMKSQDYPAAERAFAKILKALDVSAEHYNLISSYLGLAQILIGNEEGLLRCRDAASNETHNGIVFLNLACAEWALGNRRRTINAIKLGKKIDGDNKRLKHACDKLDCRKRCCFNFLPRGHRLNHLIGRLLRKPAEPLSVHELLFLP